ncbi:MAG: SusC/RagA family TonB-linked outer membrane protein [Bacteroidia bacterium]|nr:SusC/RagA family TonB-linked outer membrane protein [Bacteroidia bacterium]
MKMLLTEKVPDRIHEFYRYARKFLFCLFSGFLLTLMAWGQDIQVKGKVTGTDGAPIEGVSVSVKESNAGTTTNASGDYQITASSNGILVFTFVNFIAQEVTINGRTIINITLQSSNIVLEDVVVVGYGTQRKTDVTGSLVRVDERALREVPVANLTQALTGRAAGVDIARTGTRPGQAGQIRIRGNRSLTGSNDPLLVVDGVPYSGSINDLNPDDIASVDVLKDASATAIYGSRGSNGVILVTTKRGSKSGKPVLSFDIYSGVSKIIDKYPMMNAQEFAQYRIDANYSGGNTADEQAGLANGTNTDWQDLVYQKGFISNNSVSLTGGNGNTQYGLSGGYFKEDGIFDFMSFERYSLRTTIDQKIGNRIRIGVNSLNSLSYNNGNGFNPMYAILRLAPMLSPYLPDGTLNYLPATGSVDQPFYTNPLLLEGNKDIMKSRARRLRTFNSLYGEFEIIKGLKYRINVGLDYSQGNTGSFNGAGSFFNATSIKDQQGTLDPLINNASIFNSEEWRYLIDNLIIYENTFADVHRVGRVGRQVHGCAVL